MKVNLSLEPVSSSRLWSKEERRLWLGTLMVGCACVYAARMAMPLTVVSISKEQDWNKTDSGSVLSAFFWGYTLTQILGGYLSDRIGGVKVLTVTAVGWTLLTFWTPSLYHSFSDKNVVLSIAVISRVLVGGFQGVYFPSMSSILSAHISSKQRSFSFGLVASGTSLGSIFAGSVGSLLMEHFGWHSTFHLIGLMGMLWLLFLRYYVVDNDRRKNRILSVRDDLSSETTSSSEKLRVPWGTLFSSGAFWSLLVGHFCENNAFFILLSWLPTYFQENFPHAKGWVFNVVPWATSVPCTIISGIIADKLIAKGYSITFVRKAMTTVALCGPAFFLLVLCATKSYEGALFCLAAAVGCVGFHSSGILVNPQDIAPKYSGSVFGLMNTAGAIPGFVGVYMAGYILETTQSWNAIFTQTSLVCLFGWLVYVIFGTGKQIVQ